MRNGNSRVLVLGLFASLLLPAFWSSAQTPDFGEEVPRFPHREDPALKKSLERTIHFPGLEDSKATLKQVLADLGKEYNLTFDVNERAFRDEDVKDVLSTPIAACAPLPPMKATLGTVLRKILARVPAPSGARFVLRRDTIEITTSAAWLRELGLPPDTTSPLISTRFRNVPLRKAIEDLGFAVLFDVRIEERTRIRVTAHLDHVPMETALELLADMGGLGVVGRDVFTYVTSSDNAARWRKEYAARGIPEIGFRACDVRRRRGWEWVPKSSRPGLTLNQALLAVGEDAVVNVLIDPRVEKATRIRVNTANAQLHLASAETALELLADMADLAMVKKANVYYITSRVNAERLNKEEAERRVR
jgi:hypothetical protein